MHEASSTLLASAASVAEERLNNRAVALRLLRLMLPAVGHKATGWVSKVVAMRCIDSLPSDEKGRALAAYGLADILCNFMGRSAFYCATDALATSWATSTSAFASPRRGSMWVLVTE